LIPGFKNRRGGKISYAEWAHVIGIFQTLIYQNLGNKTGNKILDIGCGTGLLGISSEPFMSDGGTYTGIDVIKFDINFCINHFKSKNYNFIHLDVANPTYAKSQSKILAPWPIKDESHDLVLALSVWTHLSEKDAFFYFKEIHRVLKKRGKAIITFFYLDEHYQDSLSKRSNNIGRFHSTNQNKWIFDHNAYESKNWYSPGWVKIPEDTIGVTNEGLDALQKHSGLKLIQCYPGNWKEIPGVFFQDVLIFEK
jgi:SAM-dependent methyltransferase